MNKPKPMLTLSQVMTKLAQRGVVNEFLMNAEGEMKYSNSDKVYQPSDLKILKSYRFEGDSNPGDNAVLYVMTDKDDNRGMVIDSYGAESNHPGEKFDNFLRDIPKEELDEYDFQE